MYILAIRHCPLAPNRKVGLRAHRLWHHLSGFVVHRLLEARTQGGEKIVRKRLQESRVCRPGLGLGRIGVGNTANAITIARESEHVRVGWENGRRLAGNCRLKCRRVLVVARERRAPRVLRPNSALRRRFAPDACAGHVNSVHYVSAQRTSARSLPVVAHGKRERRARKRAETVLFVVEAAIFFGLSVQLLRWMRPQALEKVMYVKYF